MTSPRFVETSAAAGVGGLVVVVDVLRAFTTAAVALDRGAGPISLVSTVDEALAARRADPAVVVMGEVGGAPVDGFDLGNSPVEADRFEFAGRPVVQRTSAGTQGVVAAAGADVLLCGSLVVASAIARHIAVQHPDLPRTYVITGRHNTEQGSNDGDDDLATAELIEALVHGPTDPAPYVERVRASTWGRHLARSPAGVHPGDLAACCAVDRYELALVVTRVGGRPVLTAAG